MVHSGHPPCTPIVMDLEAFRIRCLAYPGVTEGFPFGPDVLVFKVAGKMFALLALEGIPPTANLKCDPERAITLRESHDAITPGYHMNKQHWNTVRLDGALPAALVEELLDHSFTLIASKLPKKTRRELGLDPAD